MIKELCVIGHPSKLGGADTELDHQIHLWREMGIDVYICHTGGFDQNLLNMKKEMEAIGVQYLPASSWKHLSGFNTISFCNGEFLSNIEEIKKYAKSTTFVNCMTWNFDKEVIAQENNMLDFHLYQTQHQFDMVSKRLKTKGNNYRPIQFNPYFNTEAFPFTERKNNDVFKFGRISRGDADKYNGSQLWIWETMTSPVLKEGTVLGWDDRAKKKFGTDLPYYIKGYREGEITQQKLYSECDVIILSTDTFENLPRIGFEAMSSGSVLVVDNKGGWKVLVDDGKTGWLCNDQREFVYKASRAAYEVEETNTMRLAARNKIEDRWGKESAMKSWENVFNEWEKI